MRRGAWLSLLVATLLLALLRSGVSSAQVDTTTTQVETTTTTEPTPYASVLGEQFSAAPPDAGQALAASLPATRNSPPIIIGWAQSVTHTWRGLPLWSQAAVVSGAIATISLGLIQLFRRLAEMVLEGLGER